MTKANSIAMTIDGREVRVVPGTTVLSAARSLGIDIPTLCHHDALSKYASCRVCIVEMSIEKRGKTHRWIDASCAFPAEQGLRVETNSPKVVKERKVILEFLLSRSPGSAILLAMAGKYGAEPGRFEALDKGESGCILCGKCVRACAEQVKVGAIGTSRRGVRKKIVSPLGLGREICIGCSACASVCPVGAVKIAEEEGSVRYENWNARLELRMCSECGKGFAPEVYAKKIASKVAVSQSVLSRCPECRRKVFQPFF
jgi:bidirectional [NiFe] hydrogenase diaphorase subunit